MWDWLENGRESEQAVGEEERMFAEPDCQWSDVDERMDLEHIDEERPKVVKDLREEVPEHAHVGRQVRHAEEKPVRGSEKLPRRVLDVAGREQ